MFSLKFETQDCTLQRKLDFYPKCVQSVQIFGKKDGGGGGGGGVREVGGEYNWVCVHCPLESCIST